MTPPPKADDQLRMSETEFEALLVRAAETGARRALQEVGLEGKDAAEDIRDLRSLLAGFRLANQNPRFAGKLKQYRPLLAVKTISSPSARRAHAVVKIQAVGSLHRMTKTS